MEKISVIVPCYNEEESLEPFFQACLAIQPKIPLDFEYFFVNDGSTDRSLEILRDLQEKHPSFVHYLNFSRNFGKEAAIYAGLQAATGDYITLMDADLQDPPDLLIGMYQKIQEPEVDCVAARRANRSGESALVSYFSKLFYKIMNKISETPVIDGVRDFRLMRRQMVDAILKLSEYNRFSKGLFTWIGFNTEYIDYSNKEREYGKTKWGFFSKVNYAIEGIVNFSQVPLDLAVYTGLIAVLFDILVIIFLIIRALVWNDPVGGWASLMVALLFTFGFTNIVLGIIGKYIAKIFLEAKGRPIYIIKEKR